MNIKTKLLSLSASALLITLAMPAHAVYSWTYDYSDRTNSGSSACTGSCTSETSNNGGTGPAITTTASAWRAWADQGISIQSSTLNVWNGGLGNQGGGDGGHGVDNNGYQDSILFSFTRSIALTRVVMGWSNNDADFSLLRYTGAGAPTMTGSYTGLLSNGWEAVGNYLGNNNTNTQVNAGMASSSFWLVAAANGAFGATDNNYDHFKIQTLKGKIVRTPPPGIPSPSTLPLLAISLLGLGFASRRRKQA